MTTDRLVATAAVAVALTGAIVGVLAFVRRTDRVGHRRSTIAL